MYVLDGEKETAVAIKDEGNKKRNWEKEIWNWEENKNLRWKIWVVEIELC